MILPVSSVRHRASPRWHKSLWFRCSCDSLCYHTSTLIVLKTFEGGKQSAFQASLLNSSEAKLTSLLVSEKRMLYLIHNLSELMCLKTETWEIQLCLKKCQAAAERSPSWLGREPTLLQEEIRSISHSHCCPDKNVIYENSNSSAIKPIVSACF